MQQQVGNHNVSTATRDVTAARDQLPATMQQIRPAPPTAGLFLLTPLRSSLMANPPSLLCQEPCSPNSHFPSSSSAPSQACMHSAARAGMHLSTGRFQGRSCTSQVVIAFSVFLLDSRTHRSPSTLAPNYFQNTRCYSASRSHC